MATLSNVFKIIQEDSPDLLKGIMRKSPFMVNTPHKEDFTGESIAWPVAVSGLGGGSFTASEAEGNDVNISLLKFRILPKGAHAYRTLDGLQARQSLKGTVSSEYIDVVKGEMEAGLGACFDMVARNVQRSTTNRVAVIASISTNTITLTRRTDAYLIHKGAKLVASATDGGALRDSGDFATVVSKNPSAATITVDDASLIAGLTAGDSLFVKGDINLGMAGLDTYNPATAPTGGDNVFGSDADRSVDPEAAAGVRFDSTGYTKATCLIPFLAHLQSTPAYDHSEGIIYVHPNDVADLAVQLEANRFTDSDNEYGIGVQAFRVGASKLMMDPYVTPGSFKYVPKGAGVMLRSVNGFNIDDTDDQEIVRKTGDKYQVHALFEGNMQVKKPGQLGRGDFPST
jgi:hypothetical protein